MKRKIFKQFNYKGCPVIIRKIGKWDFEYLLVYKNKFYGTFITDNLKWWQFYKLFLDNPHLSKEESTMIHFLTKAAETTIEVLIREKNGKRNINKKNN